MSCCACCISSAKNKIEQKSEKKVMDWERTNILMVNLKSKIIII